MPTIKLSVPHRLNPDEAKNRIVNLIQDTRKQFGTMVTDVQERWSDKHGEFGFKAMGFQISGTLDVKPDVVDINVNLPLAALPFKSQVENEMNRRAKALLT
jgi:hypothetical protein